MAFRTLIAAALLLFPIVPAVAQSDREGLEQDYTPSPALWRLADEDTTIYLFGTIHLLPEGFRWRSAQFDRIVRQADALVLESNDEDAEATVEQYASKIDSVQASRRPTSDRLSATARQRWEQLITASGQDFYTVDQMPLAMAMLGMGGTADERELSRREFGVETVLIEEFEESGRPILSIENNGAVMLSLMRIDETALIAELERSLTHPTNWRAALNDNEPQPDWALEHNWARGIVDPQFSMGSGKVGIALDRVLLARRNEAWGRWLRRRLAEPGTILVAVGAGHFEGQRSLHYFLDRHGLRAERIN